MMSQDELTENQDHNTTYFPYAHDISGDLVAVGLAKRGRRTVLAFLPSITKPSRGCCEEATQDYEETVGVVTYDLSQGERRLFLRATEDGISISALAREEGVSRAALYYRFRRMRGEERVCRGLVVQKKSP